MEKINKLKKYFQIFNIDGYIVPKNNEYFGEYIDEDEDNLKFISDFTGSYGFALILKKTNYLFVDGRYTLQAHNQSSKNFKIVTIPNRMPSNVLKKKFTIGYDPKIHNELNLKKVFNGTSCKLKKIEGNLIKLIRPKKNKRKFGKFFVLSDKVVGKNANQKINILIKNLKKNKADLHFVSDPENVAWLLNIRGKDSPYSPIPNCRLLLGVDGKKTFFCNKNKIDKFFVKKFKDMAFIDETLIEVFFNKLRGKRIMIDKNKLSIFLKDLIKKNNTIIEQIDQINFYKSIKNRVEIKNSEKSHLFDGVALTKFIFWLERSYRKKRITEIDAQNKLLYFRKKSKFFKTQSFPTISGTGPNGAIIHYKANSKSNRVLSKGDIYLVDSGGQYNYGTTDVTRTISLGNKNTRIKNIFTRVLKGHIAVANFKLKNNTTGSEIDKVARSPLKKIKLNYEHGTGHGVGYYLNVHEGPQAFSKNNNFKLREGMIISNEPGYYEKGKFGIRIENLITIKKKTSKMSFQNLTLVPVDKSLIKKEVLSKTEKNWINNYHNIVFKKLKNFMDKRELIELKNACSKI